MVFISYALFPYLTALQNVMEGVGAGPRPATEARARQLLDLVHLGGLDRRKPSQLPGGQQQRVAVARALACNPDVLLLDEPFSAADRSTREWLYLELAELRRQLRMPIVLVTHDVDEASMLTDRMCILSRGRTLQTGPPSLVMRRPDTAHVQRPNLSGSPRHYTGDDSET